jgi:hypothetical protein
MVDKVVPIHKIPFNNDPLTLILKDTFAGPLNRMEEPQSVIRMFVNISPTKFDSAVTNRSLKFAQLTGRLKTKKFGKDVFQSL